MNAASPQKTPALPTEHAGLLRRLRVWHLLVPWLAVMAPLTSWGLPGRAYDKYLFGGGEPWTAQRFAAARPLQDRSQRSAGADTDLDPIHVDGEPVELTGGDAERAAILLRYRLYSRQPDEMITFMALQRMHPRQLDFDPRIYQYGGAYVYLVGAAVGLSSALHLTHLTGNIDEYLLNPDLFGRFYVVARAVSLVFGALALLAAAKLAGRLGGRAASFAAFALVACSPVFINAALEAKPHLAATSMLLWATDSAVRYARRAGLKDALHLGWRTGLAAGLVLYGGIGSLLWAGLVACPRVRSGQGVRRLLSAAAVAAGVYAVTNPYLVANLVLRPETIRNNLDNTGAMFPFGDVGAGALRVLGLLAEGTGPGALLVGAVGLALALRRWPREAAAAALPAVVLLLLSAWVAAAQPAEFARFLLLPAFMLCVAAAGALGILAQRRLLLGVLTSLAVLALMRTPAYVAAFAYDAGLERESRWQAAEFLREQVAPDEALGVLREPAPFATPPYDFAHRRVVLLDDNRAPRPDRALPEWLVLTADHAPWPDSHWWQAHYELIASFPRPPRPASPIAWADKPVFVFGLRSPPPQRE